MNFNTLNRTINVIDNFTDKAANFIDKCIDKTEEEIKELRGKLSYMEKQIEKGKKYSQLLRDFIK